MTVKELIEALREYPEDAHGYVCGGGVDAVVIVKDGGELGYIRASYEDATRLERA